MRSVTGVREEEFPMCGRRQTATSAARGSASVDGWIMRTKKGASDVAKGECAGGGASAVGIRRGRGNDGESHEKYMTRRKAR